MNAREGIAFLSGSDGRVEVMRSLAESPRRPCELREETAASRTAIHRSLSGFEERGWVRKPDDSYELTAAGRHVVATYDELATVVDRSDRFSEFLAEFRLADDLPFPFDGEVCVATSTEPQAPSAFFVDRLPTDAERFRGLCPILTPELARTLEPTADAVADVEFVYDVATARRAYEAYPETMALAEERENVTGRVVSEPLRSGLALFGDEALLGAYGPRGEFRACLHSTDPELYEWAVDWYERRTERTVRLEAFTPEPEPS